MASKIALIIITYNLNRFTDTIRKVLPKLKSLKYIESGMLAAMSTGKIKKTYAADTKYIFNDLKKQNAKSALGDLTA